MKPRKTISVVVGRHTVKFVDAPAEFSEMVAAGALKRKRRISRIIATSACLVPVAVAVVAWPYIASVDGLAQAAKIAACAPFLCIVGLVAVNEWREDFNDYAALGSV